MKIEVNCVYKFPLLLIIFFFTHAKRIAAEDFQPTPEDIFRAKLKTTGISELTFNTEGVEITIVDVGGQRSERRKWLHCFDDVTSVIYLAALDEYNMRLEEDNETNRLDESLRLFGEMTASQFFIPASWILFLNKSDIFKDKIEKWPLSNYFDDCTVSNNEQSIEYIKKNMKNNSKVQDYMYMSLVLLIRRIVREYLLPLKTPF